MSDPKQPHLWPQETCWILEDRLEELILDNHQLTEKVEELEQEKADLEAERDEIQQEKDDLELEKDQLEEEKDELVTINTGLRAKLMQAKDQAAGDKELIRHLREQLQDFRDRFGDERPGASAWQGPTL